MWRVRNKQRKNSEKSNLPYNIKSKENKSLKYIFLFGLFTVGQGVKRRINSSNYLTGKKTNKKNLIKLMKMYFL